MLKLISIFRVPTPNDYDWYRPVSGRRYLPICNAHRRFGTGTLYIGVRANNHLNEYNRYKMRVISQSTGTCPTPRTMPAITSGKYRNFANLFFGLILVDFPAGFQWLHDSAPTNNFAQPGIYHNYLELSKVHYNLIFKYLSDDWFACRDMVMGLATTAQIPESADFIQACEHYPVSLIK
jgi:hypothetical protein